MTEQDQSFDYVIVGAGSAGCALADRLSAAGDATVLVLEAGPKDNSFWVKMPIGYGKTYYHPKLNWRYQSAEIPGLQGRTNYVPRGKVLGGSSSINAMVFIRGQREDFDGWAQLGNRGWSYDDVMPLYRQMENNVAGADEWRATGGPLSVSSYDDQVHPLCHSFIEAAAELGYPRNPDFNGATQEGVGYYQASIGKGVRASAAAAFLRPAMRTGRVEVLTGAHATKVLLEGRRATGIAYERGGHLCVARARREVILSAGAINTPQLMQLSGIGDPEHLLDLGLNVAHALPGVGAALQDHLAFDYLYRATRPTLNEQLGRPLNQLKLGLRYLLTRSGPLAMSVNQAGGFLRSNPDRDRPNLQFYFNPLSYTRAAPGKRQLMRPDPFPGFLLGISNCHPTSRGHVRILSPDPHAAPEIQPNFLATREDLQELVEGARMIRRFAATRALQAIIDEEIAPGAQIASDEQMAEDIRARASTVFHPCGTCAMGPDPQTSVVDAELRVHGIERLRIADASVFPRITAGNINAPSMMVGRKAGDLILGAAG